MGSIVYTPPKFTQGLQQVTTVVTNDMNIFEKVAHSIYSFFEKCREFGIAWSDFWSDPLTNTFEFVLNGVDIVATFLIDNGEVFIIAGMIGMVMVMVGHEEKGKKVTGGAIWGYLAAKVVSEWL